MQSQGWNYFNSVIGRYMENGKPTETEERFLELLQPLANTARTLYSGWRMRIYHNITEEDTEVASKEILKGLLS